MKENMKIRGQLRTYLQWPIILSVFLLAANLAVGIVSPAAGLVMCWWHSGCSCTGENV
mgnify:CR=1 FL=1